LRLSQEQGCRGSMADFPMIFRVQCSLGGRAAGKAFSRVVFSDVPASLEIVGNTLLPAFLA
jgi:hypothetical protein